MEAKRVAFTIDGRLPGLNELIAAERSNRYKGAKLKRDWQAVALAAALSQTRGIRFRLPAIIAFTFYEPNAKRDPDNISGFAHKVIMDALVQAGILADDGWNEVAKISDTYAIDRKRPRIEVTVTEGWNG